MKKLLSIFIISLLLFNVYAQGEDSVELAKEYNERIKQEDYRELTSLEKDSYTGVLKDKNLLILAVDGLYEKRTEDMEYISSLKNSALYYDQAYLTSSTHIQDDSVLTNLYGMYPRVRSFGKDYISGKDVKGLQNYFNDMGYTTSFLSTKGKYYLDSNKLGFKNSKIVKEDSFKDELIKLGKGGGKNFIYSVYSQRGSDSKSLDSSLKDLIESLRANGFSEYEIVIVGTNSQATKAENYNFKGLDATNVPIIFLSNKLESKNIEDTVSTIDLMATILNYYGVSSTYPQYGEYLYNRKFPITIMDSDKLRYITDGSFVTEVRENISVSKSKTTDIKSDSLLSTDSYKDFIYKSFINTDMSEGLTSLNQNKVVYNNRNNVPSIPKYKDGMVIMHAGGFIAGVNYSNMLDAVRYHYNQGRRYFELDIERSTDGNLVLIHDFGGYQSKFFNVTENKSFTLKEFLDFESVHGFEQMEMENLVNFLRDHKDAYVVTDIKDKNVDTLKKIREVSPETLDQIIPQIYNFSEYNEVKSLGYKNIILTLYKINSPDREIIDFVKANKLYAVTMSRSRLDSKLFDELKKTNVKIFTHTVNSMDELKKYKEKGVFGFYSDVL